MTSTVIQNENKTFNWCPLLKNGCGYVENSMENMPSEHTSDAQSNKECCGCILCFTCWPVYLVIDFISCPFRGCYYLKK